MDSKSMRKKTQNNLQPLVYAIVVSSLLTMPIALFSLHASNSALKGVNTFYFLHSHLRIAGIILSCSYWVICSILFFIFLKYGKEILEHVNRIRLFGIFEFNFNRLSVIRSTLILLIMWMPITVIMFPGSSTGGDTINQLHQFFSESPSVRGLTGEVIDAEFINDSPIFDTLLFGLSISFGRLFGSDMLGFFTYCFLQMLLIAFIFSITICYSEKLNVPPLIRLLMLSFIAVNPIYPISAFSMIKDSLFSAFLLAYSLIYIIIITKGKEALSTKTIILYTIVSLLCCMTKTTGIFFIIITNLVLIIININRKSIICATAVIYCVYSIVLPSTVYKFLDVYTPPNTGGIPGSHILYQQVISTLKKHPDSLNYSEYSSLNSIIDINKALSVYDPKITDRVNLCVKNDFKTEDITTFINIWIKVGIKHPMSYIKSLLKCCIGAYVPLYVFNQEVYVPQDAITYYVNASKRNGTSFQLDVVNPDPLKEIAIDLRFFIVNTAGAMPFISLFLSYGYYGGWVPIITMALCLYFSKKSIIGLVPMIITSLLLVMIPTLFARYITPSLYISVPSLLWTIGSIRNTDKRKL